MGWWPLRFWQRWRGFGQLAQNRGKGGGAGCPEHVPREEKGGTGKNFGPAMAGFFLVVRGGGAVGEPVWQRCHVAGLGRGLGCRGRRRAVATACLLGQGRAGANAWAPTIVLGSAGHCHASPGHNND
jgi:hypothetical protein